MGTLAHRLEAMARQHALEKETVAAESEKEAADQRVQALLLNLEQLREIVDSLREIAQAKQKSVGASFGHRKTAAEHEQILNDQLTNPDSEFQRILINAGVDPREFLREQGIHSVDTLVSAFPEDAEPKRYTESMAGLSQARKELASHTELGRQAKYRALGYLREHQPVQNAPVESVLKTSPDKTTVDTPEGPKTRINPKKLVEIKSRVVLPKAETAGRSAITFETLIAALEDQQKAFRAEYEQVFPNSTEGKRQTEALRLVASDDVEDLWKNNQTPVLAADSGRVLLVTPHFEQAERLAGRGKVKEALLGALRERVFQHYKNYYAQDQHLGSDFKAIEQALEVLNKQLPEQATKVKAAEQGVVNAQKKANRQIRDIANQEKNKAFLEILDKESEWGEPPLFNRRLNRALNNAAKDLGLVEYGQLVSGHNDYNLDYQRKPLVSRFSFAMQERDRREAAKLFPERRETEMGQRLTQNLIPTEIVDPNYIIAQLQGWQELIKAFNVALETAADKNVFLVQTDENHALPAEIKKHLPKDTAAQRLDAEVEKHRVGLPASVYAVFQEHAHDPNSSGIGRKLKIADNLAREQTEKVANGLSALIDVQLARRDLNSLQNGPETAGTLRQAQRSKANAKIAEGLVGHKERGRGSLVTAEDPLVSVFQRPAVVTAVGDFPRLVDGQAANDKVEAERAIANFTQKYRSENELRQQKVALEREIAVFERKKFKLFGKSGVAVKRETVKQMAADEQAWDEANRSLRQADNDLHKTEKVSELLANSTTEDPEHPGREQNLILAPEQLTVISQSKTIAEFFDKLRAELVAMRDAELTPEQAGAYQRYEELRKQLRGAESNFEQSRNIILHRSGY